MRNTCRIDHNKPGQFYVATSSGFNYTPINFIENVPLEAKDSFGTKLKKNLRWIFFKKIQCQKSPSFFAASDVGPILYNKPCICTGD